MPRSSAVVAGNPALASQFNNVRLDAIAPTVTFTAGENFNANTPVTVAGVDQGYSLPTLLYESGGKVFKMPGTTTNGARLRIYMAAGAGVTDSPVDVYTPGGLVPVTYVSAYPTTTDLGRNASNSSTAGAVELTTRPPYYTITGYLTGTAYFAFLGPVYNNTFWHQITVPVVSGGAITAGNVIVPSAVTGKWVVASNTFTSSSRAEVLVAASAATGADEVIQAYLPGSLISGLGVSNGVPYYLGASGAVSTTLAGTFMVGLGVGYDSFLHFNPQILNSDTKFVEEVFAGENWTVGDILYQRVNRKWYMADTDGAESGICEKVAIAVATHTGGDGSRQMVYFPGALIRNVFTTTTYTRIYPSATPGSYTNTTPPSYDTFYRAVAYATEANVVRLEPQQMEFLPTGIQEKGYVAAGEYAQSGQVVEMSVGVNFKKIMVNTPSSITLTSTATQYAGTPTANNITRFGFRFFVAESGNPGNQQTYWAGTYQTVGN